MNENIVIPERMGYEQTKWVVPTLKKTVLEFPSTTKKLTFLGYSRAGDSTGFYIPELDWAFDAGVIVHEGIPEHVFVTHTHTDHIHMLTHMVKRRKPPTFYVPDTTANLVENYLLVAQELTNNGHLDIAKGEYETNHHLKPVKCGDEIVLKKGNDKYVVKVISCDHSVDCVGYLFFEEKTKLKDEFKDKKGAEIAKLRKEGVVVSEAVQIPLFAFMGDTTANVFDTHKELLDKMPVIITECTFLEPEHISNAQATKHTIWSELQPVIQRRCPPPDSATSAPLFILIHFSWRYTEEIVQKFFQDPANSVPCKVVVWI